MPQLPDTYAPSLTPAVYGSQAGASRAGRRPPLPQILWRRKLLVILPVLLCLGAAIAYLRTATPLYTSRARFTVQSAGSRLGGETADNPQAGNFLFTQREKLMSREVLAGVLAMPVPVEKFGVSTVQELSTFKDADVPLETLRDGVEVDVGKKDDTVTVAFEGPSKEEAQAIANAIVDNFIRYQTRPNKHSNTEDVLRAYDGDRDNVQKELNDKTQEMMLLEQQYGVLSGKDQENIVFKQLQLVSQALGSQRAQTLRDKTDYEEAIKALRRDPRLVTPNSTPASVLAGADDEQALRQQIVQLQQQVQVLQQRYLPDHPAVAVARQRLDQLGAAYANALERRLLRSQAIETDLQKQFDDLNKHAVEVSAKMAQYGRLESDADRLRRLLDTLETRIHAVELQRAAGAVDIDLFEPASIARKSHPATKHTLAIALAMGLVLGVGLALVRDMTDDRLRSSDEIKNALGLPMLGIVPQMPANASWTVSAQKVVLDPTGEVAESYRSLRTAIHFGAPKDRAKTLLVTSPGAGDGKTTSAANLASVMAQAGKRVLLIDADLRNPKQHIVFGLKDNRVGLAGVLAGTGDLERAIHMTSVPGLDVLPCGPKPRNPSEMLNSPIFSEILETLADRYDHVVIDSPPVMGVADTRIMAASCDLTVLVLRATRSTRKLASLARDGLMAVGAQVLGVIVNDVPRNVESYYDCGYHYDYADHPAEESALVRKKHLTRALTPPQG